MIDDEYTKRRIADLEWTALQARELAASADAETVRVAAIREYRQCITTLLEITGATDTHGVSGKLAGALTDD